MITFPVCHMAEPFAYNRALETTYTSGLNTSFTTGTITWGVDPHPTRIVIATLAIRDTANGTPTASSITIGGVSATVHQSVTAANGAIYLVSAAVPTGTSGAVTASISPTCEAAMISVYVVKGLMSGTPISSASGLEASTTLSTSISTGTPGLFVIGLAYVSSSATAYTPNGYTETQDANVNSALRASTGYADTIGGTLSYGFTGVANTRWVAGTWY